MPAPGDTGRLLAGAVIAATLFGIIGVALGYITRSTVAAVVGAVGWVLFARRSTPPPPIPRAAAADRDRP